MPYVSYPPLSLNMEYTVPKAGLGTNLNTKFTAVNNSLK
jgi:hypothetical protein